VSSSDRKAGTKSTPAPVLEPPLTVPEPDDEPGADVATVIGDVVTVTLNDPKL
jgi:hypothetical protein